jgi:glycolate oxidase FAD binding subunit
VEIKSYNKKLAIKTFYQLDCALPQGILLLFYRKISLNMTSIPVNSERIPWQDLDSIWQEKLKTGISSAGFSTCDCFVPENVGELSDMVKYARENSLSSIVWGNGTKLSWGGLVKSPKMAIRIHKMNKIVEHAIGDLTVTVGAGITLVDLQKVLLEHNQFLPLDPSYPEAATIGGIIATADSGSWRHRYGGVRDMLLGVSFVRADGEIAKAGGRVVKNVAGYDLMKLLTGSYGSLGIISEVTLRLFPYPESSQTIVLWGDFSQIAMASQQLINSGLTPTAADLLSSTTIATLGMGNGVGLIVRFQSIALSVSEQINKLQVLADELHLARQSYREAEERQLWEKLALIIDRGETLESSFCKVGMLSNTIVGFLQEVERDPSAKIFARINASSGLGKIRLSGDRDRHLRVRSLCEVRKGFLTVLEAPANLKQQLDPWGYQGNALEMMHKLKQKFDPQNILNPGRFVGGI